MVVVEFLLVPEMLLLIWTEGKLLTILRIHFFPKKNISVVILTHYAVVVVSSRQTRRI